MCETKEFEIEAGQSGKDTTLKIEGEEPKWCYAYELRGSIDEVTQLDLHYHALGGKVTGEAEVNYYFNLPEDEEVQEVLYEQLKEKFED